MKPVQRGVNLNGEIVDSNLRLYSNYCSAPTHELCGKACEDALVRADIDYCIA